MERVLGIGGFFFRARDPKKLAQWYQDRFGISPVPTSEGGEVWTQAAGQTVFAPFPSDTDYFGKSEQMWMINFRVKDLDAVVAHLRASGDSLDDPQEFPGMGRFTRVHDPEGNPVELWQPADE
jgi:predicted enzyme related to lactoylglutathione lyase